MKRRRLKKSAYILIALIVIIVILLVVIFSKEDILMLDFQNKSLNEIQNFCEINQCKLDIKYEYNLEITKDKIISQSLKTNEKLKNNQTINVVLSKGIDYQLYSDNNVNELGRIPVMMYHGIHNKTNDETPYIGGNVDKDGYQRTAEAFRSDLEFYYKNNYRMVKLKDYVNGVIDTELGKSPIVITFDDGLASTIKVTGLDSNGNIIIDENSAIGILESFKKKYPDYNVTATFFINGTLFHQKEYNDKIIAWLLKNNYDIGNHTYGHANLSNISESATIKEVGSMYKLLNEKTDGQYVNIIALPFGTPYNTKHANFKHIISGTYDENAYETISTLQVGYESDYSPFSTSFNKTFIKRIRAYDNNGKDFDIEYNFKALEKNRYISDGNAKTVVVKKDNVTKVNSTKLQIISY